MLASSENRTILRMLGDKPVPAARQVLLRAVAKARRLVFLLALSRIDLPLRSWPGIRNALLARAAPNEIAKEYAAVHMDRDGQVVEEPDADVEGAASKILAVLVEMGVDGPSLWSAVVGLDAEIAHLLDAVPISALVAFVSQFEPTSFHP